MTERGPETGLRFTEAHFPGRAPIDSYGNGGFRFADMSHRGSILCFPSGIYGWNGTDFRDLSPERLPQLLDEEPFDFLIVGTGRNMHPVPQSLRSALQSKGIRCDPMATGPAVRTFNVLVGEGRHVGAILIAVD